MLGPRGTTGVQRHRLVTAFRKCSPEHECPAGVQPLIQRLLLLSRESCSHTAIRVPKTCGLCSLKMEPEEVCASRLLSLEMGSGCGESQGPHNALAPDAQCELQPVFPHIPESHVTGTLALRIPHAAPLTAACCQVSAALRCPVASKVTLVHPMSMPSAP